MQTDMMTWQNVDEAHWVSLRDGRVWRVTKTENDEWFHSFSHVLNPSVIYVGFEMYDTPYEAMLAAKYENDELNKE